MALSNAVYAEAREPSRSKGNHNGKARKAAADQELPQMRRATLGQGMPQVKGKKAAKVRKETARKNRKTGEQVRRAIAPHKDKENKDNDNGSAK
jgi:hypothetical protein